MEFLHSIAPNLFDRVLMTIGGAIGGLCSFLYGDFTVGLKWVFLLTVLDWIFGSFAAFKRGEWNSDAGFRGFCRKVVLWGFIAAAHGIDVVFANIPTGFSFMQLAMCAVALNELGSIVENIDRMGYGYLIPEFVRRGMKALQRKVEKIEKEAEDEETHR